MVEGLLVFTLGRGYAERGAMPTARYALVPRVKEILIGRLVFSFKKSALLPLFALVEDFY